MFTATLSIAKATHGFDHFLQCRWPTAPHRCFCASQLEQPNPRYFVPSPRPLSYSARSSSPCVQPGSFPRSKGSGPPRPVCPGSPCPGLQANLRMRSADNFPSSRSTVTDPELGRHTKVCPLSPVHRNRPGCRGCWQNSHSASAVSEERLDGVFLLISSCARLTGTPAHVRLYEFPLCELRQHYLNNTPQSLHAFIRDGICRVSGMRSRNRYLDGMIRSKGLSLHETSVSWELVAQFDDPAVFARFVIFDEAGLEAKALQGNRWHDPLALTGNTHDFLVVHHGNSLIPCSFLGCQLQMRNDPALRKEDVSDRVEQVGRPTHLGHALPLKIDQ